MKLGGLTVREAAGGDDEGKCRGLEIYGGVIALAEAALPCCTLVSRWGERLGRSSGAGFSFSRSSIPLHGL